MRVQAFDRSIFVRDASNSIREIECIGDALAFLASWPESRREQIRLQRNQGDDFRIRRAVVKSLFNCEVRSENELDALLGSFDDAQYLLLNSMMLPLQGIGADSFFLNESLPEGKTLLDFETLGDYARDDHEKTDDDNGEPIGLSPA